MTKYYFFNKKTLKIDEYSEKELLFVAGGRVFRADGEPMEQIDFAYRSFVRQSRFDAETDAREFLEVALEYYDERDANRGRAQKALERLEQENPVYLKPSSSKIPEKCGQIRI